MHKFPDGRLWEMLAKPTPPKTFPQFPTLLCALEQLLSLRRTADDVRSAWRLSIKYLTLRNVISISATAFGH